MLPSIGQHDGSVMTVLCWARLRMETIKRGTTASLMLDQREISPQSENPSPSHQESPAMSQLVALGPTHPR